MKYFEKKKKKKKPDGKQNKGKAQEKMKKGGR